MPKYCRTIVAFRGIALLMAGVLLAAALSGCTTLPEPDGRPRTASDFIGQPRPMP